MDKKRKLPEGWVLKEVLFDGTFVFDNLADLLASLKEWPYFVAIEAQRKSGILEFVCKSGHRWQLKLPDISWLKTIQSNQTQALIGVNTKMDDMSIKMQTMKIALDEHMHKSISVRNPDRISINK